MTCQIPSFPKQINMLVSARKALVSQVRVNIEKYAKEKERVLREMCGKKTNECNNQLDLFTVHLRYQNSTQ